MVTMMAFWRGLRLLIEGVFGKKLLDLLTSCMRVVLFLDRLCVRLLEMVIIRDFGWMCGAPSCLLRCGSVDFLLYRILEIH